MKHDVFASFESNVRYYCRNFPVVFKSAKGAHIVDTGGRRYLDFLAGAGTLNYGHNNPAVISRVVEYLASDGIVHSLDMQTQAKSEFITAFQNKILTPRGLSYKMMFPGPTGTNSVEAALKLARKVTGRTNVVTFSNAFHGMSLGSLAGTANPSKRAGAGLALSSTTFMPYDGYLGPDIDTFDVIRSMVGRRGSGIDQPAAIMLELVQGEGGLNVARAEWAQKLAALAKEIGALFIVDDIQSGNGRTGAFFSFEELGLSPDIVVLSKSLSGFGTPFSLVLIKPEHDLFKPGEHNGTFRGNNLAFIGATAAIETYWSSDRFAIELGRKIEFTRGRLQSIAARLPSGAARVKGRGLLTGIEFADTSIANAAARRLFDMGVIIETCGIDDQVLKLLPPLTIEQADLEEALDLIERAVVATALEPVVQAAE